MWNKRKKHRLASFIISFVVCVYTFNIINTKVMAQTGNFVDIFAWTLENDTLTIDYFNDNYSIMCSEGICHINGNMPTEEYDVHINMLDDPTVEMVDWMLDNPPYKIIFSTDCINRELSEDKFLGYATDIVIGEEVKFVSEGVFLNCMDITNVKVLSKDVDMSLSGIGYYYGGKFSSEKMTIYGYIGSTAEAYAAENGFTFIALDESATTTIQTSQTTTTTTTTVITTVDSSTSINTSTEESTTADTQTTAVQTTTAVGTTTPTTTTGAGDIITTEISTVPTTVTTPAVITTETGANLPQTGYSIWYQSLVAVAMGMIGVGSAVIVRSGVFRKKDSNS